MSTRPACATVMKTILLDVGGTFIKCSDGREIPMDSAGSREAIAASLREAVGDALEVAVAIPGPFDYGRGVFLMKHKFAAVYGESFADLVGSQPPESFRFVHDVNGMLLGALQNPEFSKYGRVALITLGTGLGFAISVNGQLQCNEAGSPAVPLYNRPYLDGIAEDYVSKRGIMRSWCEIAGKPWPEGQTVKDVALSPEGKEVFARTGAYLAEAAAPLLQELGIECLLLGGQIAKSFGLMEETLRSGLAGVPSLESVSVLPNLDAATFDGLRALL